MSLQHITNVTIEMSSTISKPKNASFRFAPHSPPVFQSQLLFKCLRKQFAVNT